MLKKFFFLPLYGCHRKWGTEVTESYMDRTGKISISPHFFELVLIGIICRCFKGETGRTVVGRVESK